MNPNKAKDMRNNRKHTLAILVSGTLLASAGFTLHAEEIPAAGLVQTYPVNKQVSAFPTNGNLSTPEAAYAACNRVSASGEQERWRQVSVRRLAKRLPANAKKTGVRPSVAREYLTAEILEVHVYRDAMAMVFARIPHRQRSIVDIRSFELEDGRWLNAGNDITGSLEEARKLFPSRCRYFDAERQRSARPPSRILTRICGRSSNSSSARRPTHANFCCKPPHAIAS
jgi:hypothetical protein